MRSLRAGSSITLNQSHPSHFLHSDFAFSRTWSSVLQSEIPATSARASFSRSLDRTDDPRWDPNRVCRQRPVSKRTRAGQRKSFALGSRLVRTLAGRAASVDRAPRCRGERLDVNAERVKDLACRLVPSNHGEKEMTGRGMPRASGSGRPNKSRSTREMSSSGRPAIGLSSRGPGTGLLHEIKLRKGRRRCFGRTCDATRATASAPKVRSACRRTSPRSMPKVESIAS